MKKKIAVLLVLMITLLSFNHWTISAAYNDYYLLNETFDMAITGKAIDTLVSEGIGSQRVVERKGVKDKYLLLKNDITVTAPLSADVERNMTVSCDLGAEDSSVSAILGIRDASGKQYPLICVKNNEIISEDGKTLGKISSGTRLSTVMVYYDLYYGYKYIAVNGKRVLDNQKMTEIIEPKSIYIQRLSTSAGNLMIDNLYAYTGDKYREIKNTGYNEKGFDYIDIDDDVGGYLFFASEQVATNKGYPNAKPNNATIYPKENTVETPLWNDYTKKDQQTYIYMKKTTPESVYMDVTTEKLWLYNSAKFYSYFMMEGDYMRNDLSAKASIPVIRDLTGSSAVDFVLLSSRSDGSLVAGDGKKVDGVFTPGKWVNIKVGIDMKQHTADVWVNDKPAMKGIEIPDNLTYLSTFRIIIGKQTELGDLKFDHVKIHGLESPYVHGEDYRTSVFYDTTPCAEYLEDKIAFHSYAGIVMVNGVKTPISCYYNEDESELYAKRIELEEILKWDITDESEYVPVKKFAEKSLGLHILDDTNGMVLLSENDIRLDEENEVRWFVLKEYNLGEFQPPTIIEALNDYLFFERPSADTIKQAFEKNSVNRHPRLLGGAQQFDYLREKRKTDEYLDTAMSFILEQADKYAADEAKNAKYQFNLYRIYDEAIELGLRLETLGFAYQITKDMKYAQRAWQHMEDLMQFPDLNPAHIIDSGSFMMGVAIGYDWIYEALTQEQRDRIGNFMIEKGLKTLNGIYYGDFDYRNFVSAKWTSNFNTIINGGNIMTALAFTEYAPEECYETLHQAMRSLEYTLKGWVPDGAWIESIGYWHMTARAMCQAFSSMENVLGTDYGMSKYQGLDEAMEFFSMSGSYAGMNNYHDVSDDGLISTQSQFAYMATRYRQPEFYALRKYSTMNNPENYGQYFIWQAVELMYYNDMLSEANDENLKNLPKAKLFRGLDFASFRGGYTGDDYLFASAHAGGVSGYHYHNDVGTFVFDLNGERWAKDHGKQTYNVVADEEAYRVRTEGHNTLVINNTKEFNQLKNTFATLKRFESNEFSGIYVVDMSDIYADADSVIRGLYIGDNYRTLTVRDEINLNKDSEVYWFMHTEADAVVEGDTVYLSKNGKNLSVRFIVDGEGLKDYEISVMKAEALPDSPNPAGQDSNAGTRKIAVRLHGRGKVNITAKLAGAGESGEMTPVPDIPISQWQLADKSEEAAGSIPNIDADIYYNGEKVSLGDELPVERNGECGTFHVVPYDSTCRVTVIPAADPEEQSRILIQSTSGSYWKMYTFKHYNPYDGVPSGYRALKIQSVDAEIAEGSNPGISMIDHNMKTRWTGGRVGAEAVFDLGEICTVDAIGAAFYKGDARVYSFDITFSEDGINYTQPNTYQSSGSSAQIEVYSLETPISARYIKLIGKGNTDPEKQQYTNVLEFKALMREN